MQPSMARHALGCASYLRPRSLLVVPSPRVMRSSSQLGNAYQQRRGRPIVLLIPPNAGKGFQKGKVQKKALPELASASEMERALRMMVSGGTAVQDATQFTDLYSTAPKECDAAWQVANASWLHEALHNPVTLRNGASLCCSCLALTSTAFVVQSCQLP